MDDKPECFDVEANSVIRSTEGINVCAEDALFGQVIAKSIAKIPDGQIKEELKIEIQQCILNVKRRAPKS